MAQSRKGRWGLRSIVLIYLSALLIVPIGMIVYQTFEAGFVDSFKAAFSEQGVAALKLTLLTVVIAVPCNTVFGILAAIVIVRQK